MGNNETFEARLCLTIWGADSFGRYEKIDQIFHYTSPSGLNNILTNEGPSLWFSRYDFLNDKTEGTHIIDIYREVCDTLFEQGQIDKKFYEKIYKIEPMRYKTFLYSNQSSDGDNVSTDSCKQEEAQKYICCFSKNCDSLPMWNYYTKGGKYEGYNIGFSFWRTKDQGIQNYYGKGYELEFFNVVYDDQEKCHIIQEDIQKLYAYYKQMGVDVANNALQRICYILSYYLKELGLKFKQRYFQHEQEVRAILSIPVNNTHFKIQYRNNEEYTIPYIAVPFPKIAVSSITVGPLFDEKKMSMDVKHLIASRNYPLETSDIFYSKIPIRY